MAQNKNASRSPTDGLGATDLAKVDAHKIAAQEYDEILELTDEMMARAVPGDGLDLLRPAMK